ncbi:MAG: hypothetical protein ABF380_13265 [Akkermansiaceae bacterium]
MMSKYEEFGSFYLGKEEGIEKREVTDDFLLVDSKDLVTHGVVLGMIGWERTGLCIDLLGSLFNGLKSRSSLVTSVSWAMKQRRVVNHAEDKMVLIWLPFNEEEQLVW